MSMRVNSRPSQGFIQARSFFLSPVFPSFLDELEVGFAVEGQVAELRDIGLPWLDGEGFLNHRGVDEVRLGGVEADPLGVSEIIGVIHHHDPADLPVDRTVHRDPARAGVVAVPGAFSLGGKHFAFRYPILVLFQPLGVSPDGHPAVMILLDEQGILGGAGLGGSEVELVIGQGLPWHFDPPSLLEDRFVGVLPFGEEMLETIGCGVLPVLLSKETVEADVTQFLGLVPKLGGFSTEGRFGPGKEEAVLMRVVGGIITRHDFAGRGMERMNISASRVMGGVLF